MKYIFTLIFIIFTASVFSQTVPTRINYQGVARSAAGTPFVNQAIGIKFRILQGGPSGAAVFTETQNLATNALGLFNTQIGSNSNLGTVSWNSGPYYLEVGIDTTGGSNYITLGSQQMASVPYALYAASAPDPTLSVNNNVLSVGANTVALPVNSSTATPTSLTLTGSGAVTTTSTGPNSYDINTPSVSVTAYTLPGISTMAQVIGTYPNFQIAVAPVITYSPTTGILTLSSILPVSPSYSYSYNITPTLSLNGNTLSVGPPTNSVLLSTGSTPFTSLASSGAAATTTLGVNSFSLSVPITSITAAGSATVLGSYPSFTISTPTSTSSSPQTSVNGVGAATVTATGSNSFDVNVATTSITAGSNMTVTGSYPSFTLSAGSQSVSVVANPTAGLARVLGAYPSYTVTVDPTFSYSSSNGSLVVTNAGNSSLSYSTNITPSLNFNTVTGVLASGPTSNSITIPVAITPSITGKGAASVNPASGNNFTVSVPATSITSVDNTATITTSGTNTFNVSVPPRLNLSAASGASLTGTYPNLTVSAPAQLSLTAINGATLSGSYPTLTVSAPAQLSITASNGATLSGSYPTLTLSAPAQLSLTASNGAMVSGSYPTLTVSAPSQLNLTGTGATTVGGTYPNISVGTQSVTVTGGTTIFGLPVTSGLAQVMGSYPNYSIIVTPNIGYSQSTGSLTLSNYAGTTPAYSYAYNITPNLTVTNNTIQSGPSSNTVVIKTPSAQAFAVTGSALAVTSGSSLFSTTFTKQAASSEIDVFFYAQAQVALALGNVTFDLLVDGSTSAISVSHVMGATTEYVLLKAVFSGLSAGSHTVGITVKASVLATSVTLDPNTYGARMILKENY